jgi:hypothetical protein
MNVQALPVEVRREAMPAVGRLVAPGGTLIVVEYRHAPGDDAEDGPPFPLRRDEIDAFATEGLTPVAIERAPMPGMADTRRWRAEFRRPSRAGSPDLAG